MKNKGVFRKKERELTNNDLSIVSKGKLFTGSCKDLQRATILFE